MILERVFPSQPMTVALELMVVRLEQQVFQVYQAWSGYLFNRKVSKLFIGGHGFVRRN